MIRKYKYKFQEKDNRDYKYNHLDKLIPSNFSLRNKMPIIYDQGPLGSCVSNAIALSIYYLNSNFQGSRLYIYFNGRAVSNSILEEDTGLTVRDGCKSIATYGLCSENSWSYNINNFSVLPPLNAYNNRFQFTNFSYLAVDQNLESIKNCLINGYPILFGLNVYTNFESAYTCSTGIVVMPTTNDTLLGGHCCLIIGYDDNRKYIECANSWGFNWGDNGCFYLPYDYAFDPKLCSDFWVIKFSNNTSIPKPAPIPAPKPTPAPKPKPNPRPRSTPLLKFKLKPKLNPRLNLKR